MLQAILYALLEQTRIATFDEQHLDDMGNFNQGYASSLQGRWLQAGITLCSAFAFTLFG